MNVSPDRYCFVFAAICLLLFLTTCQQLQKGDGDMWYQIVEHKSGPLIKADDFLDLTYSETTDDGIPVGGSYVLDRPTLMFNERPRFRGDLFAALALLSEGDSAIVKVNIDSAVKRTGFVRPRLCRGKYLVYKLRINKVIARNGLSDDAYQAAIENYRRADDHRNKSAETIKLGRFIRHEGKQMRQRSSGLYYQVLDTGTGHCGTTGDTVSFNYTASYLSGTVFQTSLSGVAKSKGIYNPLRPYQPEKSILSEKLLSGLDEALHLFPAGAKVRLIIPSALAYGAEGNGKVPPFTPVVCSMEILKIASGKRQGGHQQLSSQLKR